VALYAILKSLGIGEGDAVLVQGYTCVVVPSAIRFAGATPLFADIDPATYNAELPQLQARCDQADAQGARPKAVIVQHTAGLPADVGPIVRWARQRGLWVIEDCCHMVGSRYRDMHAGDDSNGVGWESVGWRGDAAFFSSHWSKPFSTGVGGFARARDAELQRRLDRFAIDQCVAPGAVETAALAAQVAIHKLLFRPTTYWLAQGVKDRLARLGLFAGGAGEREYDLDPPPDYAKRMSWVQRRLARREIARLDHSIAHRRRLVAAYEAALAAAGLPTLAIPNYADPVLLRYPVRMADKARVLAEARRRRVELDWVDHALDPPHANLAGLGWREGACPEAERAAAETVGLPTHRRVALRDVERAVRLLVDCR
jgi:dTDP-4-amino-4,6-dideoxygalactose transaminase